jgi:hypothetical protein
MYEEYENNSYLCIKTQKVHLFGPSMGILVEAEPKPENRREQKSLFGPGAHNVFRVHLCENFQKHDNLIFWLCNYVL